MSVVIDQATGGASGVQTFAGADTYSGGTTIHGAALLVNGSLSNSAVSVNATTGQTATLGGSGTIGGAVTVNANSAGTSTFNYLAPGGSLGAPGLLTVNNSVTINGSYLWDVDLSGGVGAAGTNYDQLHVGSLAGSGTFDINFLNNQPSNSTFWQTDHTWTSVITGSNAAGVFSAFASNDAALRSNGIINNLGQFTVVADGGNLDLQWHYNTTVPEPGSMTLAAIASLGMSAYGYRRRRAAAEAEGNLAENANAATPSNVTLSTTT
jgi:hypothetical protein